MSDFSSSTFKKITTELRDLQLNSPEGIVLMLNEENITDIQAFIQGPSMFLALLKHDILMAWKYLNLHMSNKAS
jgi:hypothetical protein